MNDLNFMEWVTGGITATKEMSEDDRLSKISRAVCDKFNPNSSSDFNNYGPLPSVSQSKKYYWSFKTYPDYAILQSEGDYFRVSYDMDENGNVTDIGSLDPVDITWVSKGND